MNLFARILSHGFALALVVLIAITLMYRGELFPGWELPEFLVIEDQSGTEKAATAADESHLPAEAVATSPAQAMEETTEETPEAVDLPPAAIQDNSVASEPTADSPVTPAADQAPVDEGHEAAVVSDVEADEAADADQAEPVQPDADDSGGQAALEHEEIDASALVVEETPQQTDIVTSTAESPDNAPVQEQAEPFAPLAEDMASQEPPEPVDSETGYAATTPQPAIPGESVPQAEPSIPSVSTPPSQLPDSSTAAVDSNTDKTAYELLAAAREAYWLRDHEMAENYYRQLIEVEPDNPDGYGELGNMYFAQGQWEQAAAAYYDAGIRMINQGMLIQAQQLVDVIRGLNGGQADELEKQVDAASQNTP
jgi:hypothetical protein